MKLICVEKCYDSSKSRPYAPGEVVDFDEADCKRLAGMGFLKRFVLPESEANAQQAVLQVHPEWGPPKPRPTASVDLAAASASADRILDRAKGIGVDLVRQATEDAQAILAEAKAKSEAMLAETQAKAQELLQQTIVKAEAILEQAVAEIPREAIESASPSV